MNFELDVGGVYPCWIGIKYQGAEIRFGHTKLLELEGLIKEAKRQALCKLPKSDWHEVDPNYARSDAP